MKEYQSLGHTGWGWKISRVFYTEAAEEACFQSSAQFDLFFIEDSRNKTGFVAHFDLQ